MDTLLLGIFIAANVAVLYLAVARKSRLLGTLLLTEAAALALTAASQFVSFTIT